MFPTYKAIKEMVMLNRTLNTVIGKH